VQETSTDDLDAAILDFYQRSAASRPQPRPPEQAIVEVHGFKTSGIPTQKEVRQTRYDNTQLLSPPKPTITDVKSRIIVSGGSGYSVNDILTVVGGTFTIATQFKVTSVATIGGVVGVITGIKIQTLGTYTVSPTNPESVTGGTGTGATFSTLDPAVGDVAGDTPVTIIGTNFLAGPPPTGTPTATVKIGGVACTSVVIVSDTHIICVTGAHAAGAVDVVVYNISATVGPPSTPGIFGTLTNGFTYGVSPVITSFNPFYGPLAGGQTVTIGGTGFVSGATVTFGGVAATSVTFVNSTQLTCHTPAHATGGTPVAVTNPSGFVGTLSTYRYQDAPDYYTWGSSGPPLTPWGWTQDEIKTLQVQAVKSGVLYSAYQGEINMSITLLGTHVTLHFNPTTNPQLVVNGLFNIQVQAHNSDSGGPTTESFALRATDAIYSSVFGDTPTAGSANF
jgi:hypothetical protein